MTEELKKSKNSIGKKDRKPLNKKQKIILIIIISIVSALVIAGVVTLIVLLTKDGGKDGGYTMPSRKIQYEYYIDEGDTIGFNLKDSFREDVPLDKFKRTEVFVDEHIVVDDSLL